MRFLVMATMAASVLAIGSAAGPADALSSLGNRLAAPGDAIPVQMTEQQQQQQQQQQQPKMIGPGMGSEARPQLGTGYRRGMRRGERSRIWIGPESEKRRMMGRGYGRRGWEAGPGFGYRAEDCRWLRRRAMETGSRRWWRRYRECMR
jgi:hypothetical protein